MVSGPDYPNEQPWRRVYDDAPEVSPTEFMRGFARRVEAQVAHDMTAIPIVRSNWFQYTLQKTGAFLPNKVNLKITLQTNSLKLPNHYSSISIRVRLVQASRKCLSLVIQLDYHMRTDLLP